MRLHLLAAAGILAASFAAHADTLVTLQLAGTGDHYRPVGENLFQDTATTSIGTATYDVDADLFTSINVSVDGFNAPFPDLEGSNDYYWVQDPHYQLTIIGTLQTGFFYNGFYRGSLDDYFDADGNRFREREYISFVGQSVPLAVTPEPSSFALLGTGLIGTAGVLRRRFAV